MQSEGADDGSQCIETTSTQLEVQSSQLDLRIRKPNPSAPMKIVLRCRGDTTANISFSYFEFSEINGDLQFLKRTPDIKEVLYKGKRPPLTGWVVPRCPSTACLP